MIVLTGKIPNQGDCQFGMKVQFYANLSFPPKSAQIQMYIVIKCKKKKEKTGLCLFGAWVQDYWLESNWKYHNRYFTWL